MLSPVIGLTYGRIPKFSRVITGAKIVSDTDSLAFILQSDYGDHSHFVLIQAGLSIHFSFKNNSLLSLFSSYYVGHTKIYRIDIAYQKNNEPWGNGKAFSNGTFWDVIGISYAYPIDRLKKKDS